MVYDRNDMHAEFFHETNHIPSTFVGTLASMVDNTKPYMNTITLALHPLLTKLICHSHGGGPFFGLLR